MLPIGNAGLSRFEQTLEVLRVELIQAVRQLFDVGNGYALGEDGSRFTSQQTVPANLVNALH